VTELWCLIDPFSSQTHSADARRSMKIMRVANACRQVVVLSHDALFLKTTLEKCPPNDRSAIQIIYHPGYGVKAQRLRFR